MARRVARTTMRLEDYVKVLRKRWWMVALVTIAAAAAAVGFSYLQTPMFRARTEYTAGVNRLDSGAASINGSSIFNNYRNLIANPRELQGIASQLKIDRTGQQMLKYVTVQPQPSEMKFVIEVDYPDVETSIAIARTVGQRLNAIVVEENRNLNGEDRLTLKEVVPATFVSYTPNKKINLAAGALLGLILGTLLVFVLEYLDDTLKTAADVERYSELPTIGAIPSAAAGGGRGRPRLRQSGAYGIVAPSKGNRND